MHFHAVMNRRGLSRREGPRDVGVGWGKAGEASGDGSGGRSSESLSSLMSGEWILLVGGVKRNEMIVGTLPILVASALHSAYARGLLSVLREGW
jgi:hypothetical protein